MRLRNGVGCYWRFKGEKEYRYGWPTPEGSLWRMGRWNGDTSGGMIVDEYDIEVRA